MTQEEYDEMTYRERLMDLMMEIQKWRQGVDRSLMDERGTRARALEPEGPSELEGVLGAPTGQPLFYDPVTGMIYQADRASAPTHYHLANEAPPTGGYPDLGARHAIQFKDLWHEDDPWALVRETIENFPKAIPQDAPDP